MEHKLVKLDEKKHVSEMSKCVDLLISQTIHNGKCFVDGSLITTADIHIHTEEGRA